MQTLLRQLFTLLTKIRRETVILEDHIILSQLNKVDRELKKLKSLIEIANRK